MNNVSVDLRLVFAQRLDEEDDLACYRSEFFFAESELIYMDGNSLGRLPCRVTERIHKALESEWGRDLIRSWNAGWYAAPVRV